MIIEEEQHNRKEKQCLEERERPSRQNIEEKRQMEIKEIKNKEEEKEDTQRKSQEDGEDMRATKGKIGQKGEIEKQENIINEDDFYWSDADEMDGDLDLTIFGDNILEGTILTIDTTIMDESEKETTEEIGIQTEDQNNEKSETTRKSRKCNNNVSMIGRTPGRSPSVKRSISDYMGKEDGNANKKIK